MRETNPFGKYRVGKEEIAKVLTGEVVNFFPYFIVCEEGLDLGEGSRFCDFPDFFQTLNKSEWFGKITSGRHSQIIVPSRYDLAINFEEKRLFLKKTQRAKYYGSGFLQVDKDLGGDVLRTDVRFEELQEMLIEKCGSYGSLRELEDN